MLLSHKKADDWRYKKLTRRFLRNHKGEPNKYFQLFILSTRQDFHSSKFFTKSCLKLARSLANHKAKTIVVLVLLASSPLGVRPAKGVTLFLPSLDEAITVKKRCDFLIKVRSCISNWSVTAFLENFQKAYSQQPKSPCYVLSLTVVVYERMS